MTIARAGVVAALAVVCLTWLGAGTASAAPLSIAVGDRGIDYGERVTVRGRLNSGSAGAAVRIVARAFPYRRARTVARGVTDARGRYELRVRPDVNTKYRAVVAGDPPIRSKSRRVIVFARAKSRTRVTRDGKASSRFSLTYSPQLRLNWKRVFWYFRKVSDPVFKVRERTRARQPRRGIVSGSTKFDLPEGRYRFVVTFCLEGPKGRDVGLGLPSKRDCPKRIDVRGREAPGAERASIAR